MCSKVNITDKQNKAAIPINTILTNITAYKNKKYACGKQRATTVINYFIITMTQIFRIDQ